MTLLSLPNVVRTRHLLLIALLLSAVFSAQAQFGSIHGIVVNEGGKPVKGAQVIATGIGPMANRTPGTATCPPLATQVRNLNDLTDETGHFVIQGLQFDEYVVTAYKQDENYPALVGTWLQFYKAPAEPIVHLTMQIPTATVEIRLGPKAGVLMGTITNASTGAPIINACAGFKLISAPDFDTAYQVRSHYRLLIPADSDVTLKVWRDGYKPWYYPGTDQNVADTSIRPKVGDVCGSPFSLSRSQS